MGFSAHAATKVSLGQPGAISLIKISYWRTGLSGGILGWPKMDFTLPMPAAFHHLHRAPHRPPERLPKSNINQS